MIIMRMKGGLGNQMFQYAFGRRLALERNVSLKLDLSWFESQQKREFQLDQYQIQAGYATPQETYKLGHIFHYPLLRKAFSLYQLQLPYWKRRRIREENFRITDLKYTQVPKHCVLEGYFQSEKYFSPICQLIKEELTPKAKYPESIQKQVGSLLADRLSVSIHVRRGDYLFAESGFQVCELDYYLDAITHLHQRLGRLNLYIFSDDPDWVKTNLVSLKIEPINVRIINTGSDVLDIYYMSSCRHHIISNSSFGWWGSWLGEKADSLIIFPQKWFIDGTYPHDMIPDRWLRL